MTDIWQCDVMKPGDLIEWVYQIDGSPVEPDVRLWSSFEESWVPVGGHKIHLLLSIVDGVMTWMNSDGLFCACVVDSASGWVARSTSKIIPRVRSM